MQDKKGRFLKGNVPWHKGKKGIKKPNSGSFKKGFIPWNKGLTKETNKTLEEASKKIGKANKGNKNRLGTKQSKSAREKMSKSRKNRFSGKNCPSYIDGRCENKDYVSWLKNKRNRKKRSAEGSHTFGEWELLRKQYGYRCPCCGRQEPEIKLTEDHIIPLSKGGSDYIDNIQPLCLHCNVVKHTKIIKYSEL